MTLLEYVQDIMSDLDMDNVNSIDDTIESLQVAQIVKSTYYELIDGKNWENLKKLFLLGTNTDLGDCSDSLYTTQATCEANSGTWSPRNSYLRLPSNITEVFWIKHNNRRAAGTKDAYQELTYLYPDEFVENLNNRDSSASNIEISKDSTGVELLIRNDHPPQYWTSFDDENIVFDAYETAFESPMSGANTQAYGLHKPSWSAVDSFTPMLPLDAESLLLAEAKSVASVRLAKALDQKAEQQAVRQKSWKSRKSWRAKGGIRYRDFGRKTPKTSRIRKSN